MPLTLQQKQALAKALIDVVERRFQSRMEHPFDHYEALITQPSTDHLVIKLQPVKTH